MPLSFVEALRAMVDLLPWREEAQKLAVHEAITTELEPAADAAGAHSGAAESPAAEPATNGGTAAAGKGDKA